MNYLSQDTIYQDLKSKAEYMNNHYNVQDMMVYIEGPVDSTTFYFGYSFSINNKRTIVKMPYLSRTEQIPTPFGVLAGAEIELAIDKNNEVWTVSTEGLSDKTGFKSLGEVFDLLGIKKIN